MARLRKLGVGQTEVLRIGLETPVSRETLARGGHKTALFSLKRLGLVGEDGRTTQEGQEALERGTYRIESDPLAGPFEQNVRVLMAHWKLKRLPAIRRAVARAVDEINRGGG